MLGTSTVALDAGMTPVIVQETRPDTERPVHRNSRLSKLCDVRNLMLMVPLFRVAVPRSVDREWGTVDDDAH